MITRSDKTISYKASILKLMPALNIYNLYILYQLLKHFPDLNFIKNYAVGIKAMLNFAFTITVVFSGERKVAGPGIQNS